MCIHGLSNMPIYLCNSKYIPLLGSCLSLHTNVNLKGLAQIWNFWGTRIDKIPSPGILNNFQGTRSRSEPPHSLPGVKEIHFIPKQYAPKTISKMGPGFPWPDSYHSRAANGPLGPEVPKYLRLIGAWSLRIQCNMLRRCKFPQQLRISFLPRLGCDYKVALGPQSGL